MRSLRTLAFATLALSGVDSTFAQLPSWSQVTLNGNIVPLENRIAALGPGHDDPDLLVFTLWSTAVNVNRLGAFRVPFPYDGTNVTFTQNIDVGPLFAVGDICVVGEDRALVPYVKANGGNFDVFAAEFNGSSWATAPLPQTSADDYHASDCFITSDGVFVMVLNNTQQRVEFYRAPLTRDPRAATVFTLHDTLGEIDLGDPPQTPFNDGAIPFGQSRMSLFVVGTFSPDFLGGFEMDGDLDGYLLIGSASTGDIDGSYLPRNYDNASFEQDGDLPIRRSRGSGAAGEVAWFVNQQTGQLRLTRFGLDNAADDQVIPLGAMTPGSLLNFQGVDVAEGPDGNVYVVADRSFQVTPDLTVNPLSGYPFQGTGGPANLVFPVGMNRGFAVGPGSQILGVLDLGMLFLDGFETNNTDAWDNTAP